MTLKKTLENDENAGNQHFLFPQCLPILSRTNFAIWITFSLSSAKAFNLDWSEILSFGRANPFPGDKILDWSKMKQTADILTTTKNIQRS